MTSPLRLAVIGLGWVALHRHIPAIRRSEAFRLVGVVDRRAGLAEKTARRLGLSRHAQTDDLSAITWLDEIDAVVIAAPPMDHAALTLAALAKGKHVLTEKPFAMNEREGEAMVRTASEAGKILAVTHNFQFSRAAMKLEADLAAGRLGAVRRIAATQKGNPKRRLPSWYETLPLGLFYDESPHFFYLLRRLAASELRLEKAYGIADPRGASTPSSVHLLYLNDQKIPLTIDCQFDSAVSEWHVLVTGEKALGIVDIFRDIYIRLPNDGAHDALSILRTSLCAIGQHAFQHIPNGVALMRGRLDYGNDALYARLAQSVATGQNPAFIGADDALAVLRLQHEAIRAVKENLLS